MENVGRECRPRPKASLVSRLTGCTMHDVLRACAPTLTLWLNGKPVLTLLDSKSAIIRAGPSAVPTAVRSHGSLAVTCAHGDMREVPTAEVQVGSQRDEWPLTIGLVKDLPEFLFVGRDWPGFCHSAPKKG